MKNFFLALLLLFSIKIFAATVDTVAIYSQSMKKNIKCVVIKPDNYKKKKLQFPTVYLLHGYSGNFSNWIKLVPQLKDHADEFQIIIVTPDGHYSSWYFDSPIDSTMRYETHIAIEVPEYIDKNYRTIKNRKARAITGLSMGGHGGLFLGFRHAGTFGACGSMSGGVELYSSRNKYDIINRIGDTVTYAENWKKYSVFNVIENKPSDSLAIIIDCGVDDYFINSNRQLHQKMLSLKIFHDYIERPGNHNWAYWSNAVYHQLFYFRNYFKKMNIKNSGA